LRFDGGYEYHWATWKSSFRPKHEIFPCELFATRGHSHDAWGQVGYLNTWWNICKCWDVGIGVKYQFWKAKKGSVRPTTNSFAGIGCDPTERNKLKNAGWRSLGVTLDLAYTF
jgi:hypothetical protein